ncbi:MAG: IS21 family transposase [Gemmatimonadota bacterium]|nr:IS21 family transposase [Gemmatimonadota bacterium]
MRTPDDVAEMVRLHRLGLGAKAIARQLGCARNTVKRYLAQGGWARPARARRATRLEGLEAWVRERFYQHRGNADVVRQDLAREHGVVVSLRTVERAVAAHRQALRAEARATVRFETAPGEQLQVDFGVRTVEIAGCRARRYFFVATLGYSRRCHVRVFGHERQQVWFDGLESAFRAFGGVPATVLLDNARALVVHHNPVTREVTFHPRLVAFAKHWGFRPIACAPYRARTKGKDERGVGYVKRNALAGHRFATDSALEAHLAAWTRDIADVRVHGTTGEPPAVRFARDEAARLAPLADRPTFQPLREWTRRVQADCTIELHRNWYSVPWALIGETVRVYVAGGHLRVEHGATVVAEHTLITHGTRVRRIDPTHLTGISVRRQPGVPAPPPAADPPALLRPLAEYAAAVGEGSLTPPLAPTPTLTDHEWAA